ncbi:MAG TPA: TolC family protein [Desulfobacteraceae bacterium]|nr:TolC family protein [Desulfobacteraceae bacterium]HPJ67266.1 TolC family protein [Desulfobacteraceae bacterium]
MKNNVLTRPAIYMFFISLLSFFAIGTARASDPGENADLLLRKDSVNLKTDVYKPRVSVPSIKPDGAIEVSVEDAILLALENNRALFLERIRPLIKKTYEDEESALFDPVLNSSLGYSRESSEEKSKDLESSIRQRDSSSEAVIGVSKYFPTGTEAGIDISYNKSWSNKYSDWHESRVGLSITQALLRGMDVNANLASIRQAVLDTVISEYELRGFAEFLVSQVEETYWDYAREQMRIKIFEESLDLVEQYLRETEEMINVGKLAETELTAVQAERALRQQDLINARSSLETRKLQLIRLLNPPCSNPWDRDIRLLNGPIVPRVILDDVNAHVEVSLRMRSEVNEARLRLRHGDLEIVKTKNGLLPKMDLFINLGKSGYADSFSSSVRDIDENSYDISVGLNFQYPFHNREAKALHKRALLSRDQLVRALENLSQLIETDVRAAYIEVNRAKQQISASAATRKLQEEKLRIEEEKFRVGRSTNFLVAQVQRDLVSSQISEVEAVVGYLKALVELHRLEGSLLERRGIIAPGREPVEAIP